METTARSAHTPRNFLSFAIFVANKDDGCHLAIAVILLSVSQRLQEGVLAQVQSLTQQNLWWLALDRVRLFQLFLHHCQGVGQVSQWCMDGLRGIADNKMFVEWRDYRR